MLRCYVACCVVRYTDCALDARGGRAHVHMVNATEEAMTTNFRIWVGIMNIVMSDTTTAVGISCLLIGASLIGHALADKVWGVE